MGAREAALYRPVVDHSNDTGICVLRRYAGYRNGQPQTNLPETIPVLQEGIRTLTQPQGAEIWPTKGEVLAMSHGHMGAILFVMEEIPPQPTEQPTMEEIPSQPTEKPTEEQGESPHRSCDWEVFRVFNGNAAGILTFMHDREKSRS